MVATITLERMTEPVNVKEVPSFLYAYRLASERLLFSLRRVFYLKYREYIHPHDIKLTHAVNVENTMQAIDISWKDVCLGKFVYDERVREVAFEPQYKTIEIEYR